VQGLHFGYFESISNCLKDTVSSQSPGGLPDLQGPYPVPNRGGR